MRSSCLSFALLLAPGVVSAQVYIGPSKYTAGVSTGKNDTRTASDQSWALEIKFSPYLPALDEDTTLPDGETPFADIFSDNKRIMARAQLEYQALRLGQVASLGVGFGAGFYQAKGFGLDANNAPTEDINKFRVVPFALDAVLRVDYLVNKGVPLAPFVKGGLDAYYWGNRKNGDFTKFAQSGNNVQGATFGYHGAVGLALDMGFLDPNGAINMDHNFGVNHSYLFAAVEASEVNDFNSGKSFDFSATLFNIGIAAEF
jgi:hypothetical protein